MYPSQWRVLSACLIMAYLTKIRQTKEKSNANDCILIQDEPKLQKCMELYCVVREANRASSRHCVNLPRTARRHFRNDQTRRELIHLLSQYPVRAGSLTAAGMPCATRPPVVGAHSTISREGPRVPLSISLRFFQMQRMSRLSTDVTLFALRSTQKLLLRQKCIESHECGRATEAQITTDRRRSLFRPRRLHSSSSSGGGSGGGVDENFESLHCVSCSLLFLRTSQSVSVTDVFGLKPLEQNSRAFALLLFLNSLLLLSPLFLRSLCYSPKTIAIMDEASDHADRKMLCASKRKI